MTGHGNGFHLQPGYKPRFLAHKATQIACILNVGRHRHWTTGRVSTVQVDTGWILSRPRSRPHITPECVKELNVGDFQPNPFRLPDPGIGPTPYRHVLKTTHTPKTQPNHARNAGIPTRRCPKSRRSVHESMRSEDCSTSRMVPSPHRPGCRSNKRCNSTTGKNISSLKS